MKGEVCAIEIKSEENGVTVIGTSLPSLKAYQSRLYEYSLAADLAGFQDPEVGS